MTQKIVIKVQMTCDKCRRSALTLAGSTYGVQSVAIEGEERDQLVVVGDGVDATSLASCLRKAVKVGRADIIKGYPYYHPGHGYYWPPTGAVYPYAAGHCYVEDSDEDSDEGSWCTIM
uniref:HMA domain-containing protein n=1 Tax=Setaria viridis TaxID=4556 RepID=A0A4U6TVM7_SETVI|nr:hypothetical protein SEVIR_7G139100v2 [Setaria viridis]